MRSKIFIAITVFILFIILSIVFSLFSVKDLLSKAPVIDQYYKNATVTVNSRKGVVNVFLDNKEMGETPVSSLALSEGTHEISLQKVNDEKGIYGTQQFFLDVHENTEAIIDVEMLPNGMYAGYVLYYSKAPRLNNDKGYIYLSSEPQSAVIKLDDEILSESDLNNKQVTAKKYDLKIEAEGYESLEFPVIIREGYNLNVRVSLLPIPIKL